LPTGIIDKEEKEIEYSFMNLSKLSIDKEEIVAIAHEFSIQSIAVFGSALRVDFGPESDIDLLIELSPERKYSFFDLLEIKSRFEQLFKRKVDLIEKGSLRNPYRKKTILKTAREIYAAQH